MKFAKYDSRKNLIPSLALYFSISRNDNWHLHDMKTSFPIKPVWMDLRNTNSLGRATRLWTQSFHTRFENMYWIYMSTETCHYRADDFSTRNGRHGRLFHDRYCCVFLSQVDSGNGLYLAPCTFAKLGPESKKILRTSLLPNVNDRVKNFERYLIFFNF